jgi:hypothetical protein
MDLSPDELTFQQQAAREQSDPGYTNTGYDARFDFDPRTIAHNARAAWQDRCAARRTIRSHRRPRSQLSGARRRPGGRRRSGSTRAGPNDDSGCDGPGEPAPANLSGQSDRGGR